MSSLSMLTCPRCAIPLQVGQAAAMTLHGCRSCGGVWLGSACAQRLAAALPEEAIVLAARASSGAVADADVTLVIHCPVCEQPMKRTHAAAARLDLDLCGAHGTWYDRHELERVARAIAARRSQWRRGAGLAAGAAVAGAAIAGAAAQRPSPVQQGGSTVEAVVDATDVAEIGVEVAAEGGAEIAADLLGGVFSLLGSLFD